MLRNLGLPEATPGPLLSGAGDGFLFSHLQKQSIRQFPVLGVGNTSHQAGFSQVDMGPTTLLEWKLICLGLS